MHTIQLWKHWREKFNLDEINQIEIGSCSV